MGITYQNMGITNLRTLLGVCPKKCRGQVVTQVTRWTPFVPPEILVTLDLLAFTASNQGPTGQQAS